MKKTPIRTTLAKKLLLSFLSLSLISVFIAGMGIYSLLHLSSSVYETEKQMDSLPVITDLLTDLSVIESSARDAVINFHNSDLYDKDQKNYQSACKKALSNRKQLEALPVDSTLKTKIVNANKTFQSVYISQMNSAFDFTDKNQLAQADDMLQKSFQTQTNLSGIYSGLMSTLIHASQEQSSRDRSSAGFWITAFALLSVGGIAVSILLGYRISRSISQPVKELAEEAHLFSEGRLRASVQRKTNDEIGDLTDSLNTAFLTLKSMVLELSGILNKISQNNFEIPCVEAYGGDFAPISDAINRILEELNAIFRSIRTVTAEIDRGSLQVSIGSKQVERGAAEQTLTVNQLYTSIKHVNEIADNTTREMDHAVGHIGQIFEKIIDGDNRMSQLLKAEEKTRQSAGEIQKINRMISDIAQRTNLLALNAAVEAARAGTAGNGFAVVAAEVRNLAGQSAEAAKQTSAMIDNSIRSVEESSSIAADTARSLSESLKEIETVSKTIQEVRQDLEKQAASMQRMTQDVGAISAVVEKNTAAAKEGAAASQLLLSRAELLKEKVSTITLREAFNSDTFPVRKEAV